jgi:hypothetical protein
MPLDDIEFLSPPGAIKPTGPWSLGVRAGDFVFVAGMRGIDPATNKLVDGDEARIRQAYLNMKTIVAAAGGSLRNAARPTHRAPSSRSAASIRTTAWKWRERSFVRCVASSPSERSEMRGSVGRY